MSSGLNSIEAQGQQSFSNTLQNFKQCTMCKQNFRNYKRHFAGCQHDLNVCYQCYRKHIDEKMQMNEALTCPFCPAEMLIDSQEYSTFLKHMPASKQPVIREYILEKKSIIQPWYCSNKNCGGRIPHEICEKCGQQYCPKCKEKEHPLQTCLIGIHSSTTGSIQSNDKLACPKCGNINTISIKDKKKAKKCEKKYCNIIMCVEHKVRWNKSHDILHPVNERIYAKTPGCQSCVIY